MTDSQYFKVMVILYPLLPCYPWAVGLIAIMLFVNMVGLCHLHLIINYHIMYLLLKDGATKAGYQDSLVLGH